MDRTAVVTDSTARPVAERVLVVDLDVVLDGVPVREVDTDLDRLLADMAAGVPVGTSRPSPDGFDRAYRQAADAGASAVVSVHLSGALSGTVEAARLAAARSDVRVEVLDSLAVGAVLTAAVDAACAAAADGGDRRRVVAAARLVVQRSRTWFSPATAAHLQRGGRAADVAAPARAALSARPLLLVHDGRLEPVERARTTSRALARLAELAAGRLDELGVPATRQGHEVVVQHAGAPEAAQELVRLLRAGPGREHRVRTAPLSPVLAAHVGPGAVGVAVLAGGGPGR